MRLSELWKVVVLHAGFWPRMAARGVRMKAAVRRGDGSAPPPMLIQLQVTSRCNLRCAMCGQWGPDGVRRGARQTELTFCPDYPDYTLGSLADHSFEELWEGERAKAFRALIRERSLPLCGRCCWLYLSGETERPG